MPKLAVLLWHLHGRVHTICHSLQAPGVDPNRSAQRRRAADKLADDEHGVPFLVGHHAVGALPGDDVLVGHEVHPVPQRRDDDNVGDAVVGDPLVEGHAALDEHDRLVSRATEAAVDAVGAPNHLLPELLDVAPRGPRGVHDLHQDSAPDPLPVHLQHQLHSLDLELDALEHVHVVDPHHDLLPLKLVDELPAAPLVLVPCVPAEEAVRLDARGHDLNPDIPAIVLDRDGAPRGDVLQPEHPAAA
mmetsp:Transcript_15488/g.36803  ORF Transcript_15488/g.36803 Transcript_15488/m.36803 type:complete len:245 (-) Transcript_15488:1137-1871(-)